MFQEIRALSQAVLQNGGSLHDVIELYSTNSMREMKKVFKTLKERQEQIQDQQMQQKQQEMEQQQQQSEAALQQAAQLQQEKLAHDDYQAELDRINKKEIALIAAESKGELSDVDQNKVPDVLEMSKLTSEQTKAAKDYEIRMADIQSKAKQNMDKMQLERQKLQVERENQKNDIEVAKINASNRASKKSK
jgi:hypothetical protein